MNSKAQSDNNLAHKRWQREAVLSRGWVLRKHPETFKRIQREARKWVGLRLANTSQEVR